MKKLLATLVHMALRINSSLPFWLEKSLIARPFVAGYDAVIPRPLYSLNLIVFSIILLSSCSEVFLEIHQNADTLKAYEKFEISFNLSKVYDNPYDYKEIDVLAGFTDPEGKKVMVPAFWYEGYDIDESGKAITKTGVNRWMVRFTPTVSGVWSYQLSATDSEGTKASVEIEFLVEKANQRKNGFIRVHPTDKLHYQYENSEETFFAAGLNIDVNAFLRSVAADSTHLNWGTGSKYIPPWTGFPGNGFTGNNLYTAYSFQANMINSLGENGGKAARFIADIYYHPLEAKPDETAYGSNVSFNEMGFDLGRYHQVMCFLLDKTYENAEKYDIGIIHTAWDAITDQPYSAGFCYGEKKGDELIKRRLRYTLARWGYSTSYWMTEYFNEYNQPYDSYWQGITEWLKAFDPYNHQTVFTSHGHGGETGPDAFITHTYDGSCWKMDVYKGDLSPAVMGEFGGYHRVGTKDPDTYDPDGNWVRQTLWNGMVSNWAGALTWWTHPIYGEKGCDAYEDIYPALNNFLKKENLAKEAPWKELDYSGYTEGFEHIRLLTNKDREKTFLWVVRTPPGETSDRPALSGRWIAIDLPEGGYTIEWWDSKKGEIINAVEENTVQSKLKVLIPDSVTRDIAAKILKDDQG